MKLLVIVIAVLATADAIQHVGPMPADMPTGSNACNDWCGVRDIDTRRCWAKSGIAKGVVPWVGTVNETKVAYMCDCKEGYYRGTKDGFKTKHGDFCHKLQEAGSDPCNNECGKNMECFHDYGLGYYCDCKEGYVRGGYKYENCNEIPPKIYKIQCGSEECKDGYFRGIKDGTKKENGEYCHKKPEVVVDGCIEWALKNGCDGENMKCIWEEDGTWYGKYSCRCNEGYWHNDISDLENNWKTVCQLASWYKCMLDDECRCKEGYYRATHQGIPTKRGSWCHLNSRRKNN